VPKSSAFVTLVLPGLDGVLIGANAGSSARVSNNGGLGMASDGVYGVRILPPTRQTLGDGR
jgi:hypothetical protein